MTAVLTTADRKPDSPRDDELAPRLSRLGALRSAWGVLAPAAPTCDTNQIGEAGAEKLAAALPGLASLQVLYLDGNEIGDAGREKLRAAKLPSLFLEV